MLGVNRTAEGGRTVFFEYLRIEAQAERARALNPRNSRATIAPQVRP